MRLAFEKTGPTALLGHLDLIRELPRVLRRAGAKTAYTQGFHPKADMTFGPALSLGIASLDEYLDIRLIDPPEPSVLIESLNRAANPGLRFRGAKRLGPNDPRLSTIIDGARYVIALSTAALSDAGGEHWLEDRLGSFHAAERLIVRRVIKGIGKLVDVKNFVVSAAIGDEASRRIVGSAGLVGRFVPLDVTVRLSPSGAVKAAEVVEAITGDAQFPFKAVRAALTGKGASPLDLEAHRVARKPPDHSVLAG
jgi:radical SAM-linked protein